ncbi:FKBP-type peptidyl-prolyl cis-trans isomerase [Candidatus Sumerlaeota bacterium]|nr:FKBP-type peptidyl-prolyl cis-trans isomerase [Candidatus Sumerlaeota bacterium]
MKRIAPLALVFLFALACKNEENSYDQRVPQNVTKQIKEKKAAEVPAAAKPAGSTLAASSEAANAASPQKVELGDGLSYTIITQGTGDGLKAGDSPKLKTVLTTPEGKAIWQGDFAFTIGSGMAVKGFDKGVVGMKTGEKRTIFVPAAMGYGAAGKPPSVGPNQDLVFTVERQ